MVDLTGEVAECAPLHVNHGRLVAVLRPACEAIGVPVKLADRLDAAYEALFSLAGRFGPRGR